ncbi:MAG: PQQ-like beta-propeller repeat protein [Bryobacterales bacterium]|nr:PQQ-like beta-propeller repeat protein [Bryobacterales bacterium]
MRTLLLVVTLTSYAHAADWPQWRGPNRDAKSTETGLLKKWPEGGPKLVWKAQGLGAGYSNVTVAAGRVYTLGQRGDTQYVMAFDEATGKKLWEVANGSAYRERRGDGPRSVPTVEGDRLWAFSADGTLSCLEAKTGKKIWGYNVTEKFGAGVPHWGYSESPLIDGDNLIVLPGGSGASVVALNKNTGAVIWKSQSDSAGYSSASLGTVGKIKQVMVLSSQGAMGMRADNGELLWRYDKVANRTANVATPIFHNNHVFYSTDYGTGCALLKLQPNGGSVKATEVYFNRDMKNHHASSILIGDHLYGFSSAILTAMNFMTGEVAWRDRSVGKGSLVYADGMLYLLSEDGVVGLAEATPQAYREVSRFTIQKSDRPTWANPVIANGKLYIRDQDTLYNFDIKNAR